MVGHGGAKFAISSEPEERSVYSDPPFWIRGAEIGRGASGGVYIAEMIYAPPPVHGISHVAGFHPLVAVKSARADSNYGAMLLHEKNILSLLQGCPFIIQCYGDDTTENKRTDELLYNIFLEYASGGSLFDFVWNRPSLLSESRQIKQLLRQILRGVDHIHDKGFVHCDLKPENVVLVKEKGGGSDDVLVAKICDFGLSKKSGADWPSFTIVVGTRAYLAPECVVGENSVQEQCSDIWAVGVTALFMLTKRLRWTEDLSHRISNEARDFLIRCFEVNPVRRSSARILLSHPFVANIIG